MPTSDQDIYDLSRYTVGQQAWVTFTGYYGLPSPDEPVLCRYTVAGAWQVVNPTRGVTDAGHASRTDCVKNVEVIAMPLPGCPCCNPVT